MQSQIEMSKAAQSSAPKVPNPDYLARFHLLGPFRVFSATGTGLLPRSHKTQGLLAYLAASGGRSVRRTRIAGLLWDRVPEDQARNSLRQALAELSGVFAVCASPLIEPSRDEIRLRTERCWIDLPVLETPLGDPSWMQVPAGRVGMFLDELDGISVSFDHWLAGERARVENRLREVYEARMVQLAAQHAPPDQLMAVAQGLLEFNPAHERAWRTLIRSLAEMGDTAQALREYARCEETLKRLLDITPSAETVALRDTLKGQSSRVARAARRAETTLEPVVAAFALSSGMSDADMRASILVLPFLVQSDQSDAEFFSSAITEGVIHQLSGIGDLFVIGRGTSLTYLGRTVDPRAAGQEVGVSYVLSGSVFGSNGRLRVFTELVETSTGRSIHNHRHEVALTDLFDLQDLMSGEIVSRIAPSVRAHELARARRKPPATMTAYDLMLRGLDVLHRLKRGSFDHAGDLLRQAIALDPTYAAAHAHLATWHNYRIGQGWSTDTTADAAAAEAHAIAALEHDQNDAVALAIRGQVMSFTRRDYSGARHYLDHALSVGPSNAMAWALSSATHGWTGNGGAAIEHAERALRLSPFDPFAYFAEHMLSQGYYVNGNYPAAVHWGRSAAARNRLLTSNLRTLAAALVAMGDLDGAKEEAAKLLRLEPGFRLRNFVARTAFGPALRDAHAARLRAAGLPD